MSDKAIYTIELNDRLTPGVKKAVAAAIGLDSTMDKTKGKAKGLGGGLKGLAGGVTSLLGPIGLAVTAAQALGAAFNFASDSVKQARNFESLQNAIDFASGSAAEGAKNMKFLSQTADELGTPFLASAEAFKQFSAAAIGTNLQGESTRKIFKQVSMAMSVLGVDAENSKGAFLALSQMISKGKVSSEELRQQLGERLPGAMGLAAKAMGVTTAELDDMLKKGQVLADDFLPKFGRELEKTFSGGVAKASKSAQAQFNRFNKTVLELKLSLGRALMPAVNSVMGVFMRFVNFLKANKEIIMSEFVNPLKQLFTTLFTSFAEGFGMVSDSFETGLTFAEAFRAVLKGVGFYIKNVLIPVYSTLYKVLGTVFGGLFKMWKGFVNTILSGFKYLWAYLSSFVTFFYEKFAGLGDRIMGALTMDRKRINEASKRMREAAGTAAKAFNDVISKDVSLGGIGKALAGTMKTPVAATTPGALAKAGGFTNFAAMLGTGKKTTATTTTTNKDTSTSVDSIKSGRPTNINIDIGKLVETMNITATDVNDLTGQVKDMIAQTLMSAVNNVNNIAGA